MPFAIPLWLAPFLAPVLAKIALAIAWLPAGAAIARALKIGSYVAALAFGVWFGAKALAWWQGDLLTEKEAQDKAAAALAAATLDARERAVAEKERSIAAREAVVAMDEAAITELQRELQNARGNNQGGGAVAISGDDEWLRAWLARRR